MTDVEAPHTLQEKEKAVEEAVAGINKDFGAGSIMRLDSNVKIDMPHIPTGIWSLDHEVLGIGGFPRGRISEVFGPESGGKTTLALRLIANAQKLGGIAAFVDAEHALDPKWAALQGVNVGRLLVCQPDCGEDALQVVEALIDSKGLDVIVVDSVAALVPRAELEGDIGDSNMGLQARLMSQAMRKLTGKVNKAQCVLLFINQVREKIGVMFGNPETTTGGRALKFYSSVRLDVRKISAIKKGDVVVGNRIRIKGTKVKVSPPHREIEIDLLFDGGFDTANDLLEAAVARGVVEKSGSWYSFKGHKLGQGSDKAIAALTPDDIASIQNQLKEYKTNV